MSEFDLSIVIVNWNTRDLLAQCLQSIYDTINDLDFETIVVDNASTDGSVAMIEEQFPGVHLITNRENVGFAKANNQAMSICRGKYVLLLNSDAFVKPTAIEQMLKFAESHQDVAIVGPQLYYPDGKPQISCGRFPSLTREVLTLVGLNRLFAGDSERISPSEVDWVAGACLLTRLSALQEVHFFDSNIFMFGEEIDLCYRVRQEGWKIWCLPEAKVVHIMGGSTGQGSNRTLMLYQGKLRYFRKHCGTRSAHALMWAMRISARAKETFYTFLERVGLEQSTRRQLWHEVRCSLQNLEI